MQRSSVRAAKNAIQESQVTVSVNSANCCQYVLQIHSSPYIRDHLILLIEMNHKKSIHIPASDSANNFWQNNTAVTASKLIAVDSLWLQMTTQATNGKTLLYFTILMLAHFLFK